MQVYYHLTPFNIFEFICLLLFKYKQNLHVETVTHLVRYCALDPVKCM
jgi:hypothetical protein